MTLTRTAFKRQPAKEPIKRSPMKRSAPLKDGTKKAAPAPRARMKSKGPKMTPIRASARGEACTLRLPVCNGDSETTVWCHSNRAEDGKGMGIKSRDEEGCYGCSSCHAFLDGGYAGKMPRSLVDKYFDLARTESQAKLKQKGLIP